MSQNLSGGTPPAWWVMHGNKIKVGDMHLGGTAPPTFSMSGSAVSVVITKNGHDDYKFAWSIDHGVGRTGGSLRMGRSDLERAFGLTLDGSQDEELFREKGYKVDAACQGAYFRLGSFLNIPHPGTGLQGDPNLSIRITPEIQTGLRVFFTVEVRKTA